MAVNHAISPLIASTFTDPRRDAVARARILDLLKHDIILAPEMLLSLTTSVWRIWRRLTWRDDARDAKYCRQAM